eukprot:2630564-Prymnesium_polylepis.1
MQKGSDSPTVQALPPTADVPAGVTAGVTADLPGVSVHECLPPAASQDGETSGGDGGCTARALTTIGVFPSTSAAVRELDAEIAPMHQKLCRERGECDESEAGIRGEQWHQEASQTGRRCGWMAFQDASDQPHPASVRRSQDRPRKRLVPRGG